MVEGIWCALCVPRSNSDVPYRPHTYTHLYEQRVGEVVRLHPIALHPLHDIRKGRSIARLPSMCRGRYPSLISYARLTKLNPYLAYADMRAVYVLTVGRMPWYFMRVSIL